MHTASSFSSDGQVGKGKSAAPLPMQIQKVENQRRKKEAGVFQTAQNAVDGLKELLKDAREQQNNFNFIAVT